MYWKCLYAKGFAGPLEYTKNEQGRGTVMEIMTPGPEEEEGSSNISRTWWWAKVGEHKYKNHKNNL